MSKYTDRLLTAVHEVAGIIYYQAPLGELDEWLAGIIDDGLWEVPQDEGAMDAYQ